ncbi:MAG: hypothetical protein M1536_06860 [Firmicutes bacterium]|nr:hypothetical protein [Bacillota bacterium]
MEFKNNKDIWDEFVKLAPNFAGILYNRIEKQGLQWPCPTCEHPGTRFLHSGGQCVCGKAVFSKVDWHPPAEQPDKDYPFILTTGRRLWHYHTGTQTRNSRGLNEIFPEELLEVNPVDGASMELNEGDYAVISSRRGSVKMKVRLTERSPEGTVFTAFHFHEACGNVLTNNVFDPVTDTAEYKACAVKIMKAHPGTSQ